MNLKALLAEFIGTFALVFVGIGAIATDALVQGQSGVLAVALAHGIALAVMVSATAAVSGGHINPAVTIGMLITQKIDALNAGGYIAAQCLGGIAAAFCIKLCLPAAALQAVNMGTPGLGNGITSSMALMTEVILTFFLVFVIFGTAVSKRAPQVGGLFIGLTVTMDILIGGPITGAAMNPARHLGPALMGGGLENIGIYWIGPVVGGILGALTYNTFLLDK